MPSRSREIKQANANFQAAALKGDTKNAGQPKPRKAATAKRVSPLLWLLVFAVVGGLGFEVLRLLFL